MQNRFRIPLLAVIAVLILASCSKKNKEGRYIPKDAAVAVHVNGASLSSKLPWEEVKQNVLFQEMYKDSSTATFIKQALENPDNSGIDTKNSLVFFAQKDSLGGLIAFTGTIKDAEKFKLFTLDITKGGVESEQDGVNYISKAPVCVGWNKEKFLYIVNTPELNMQAYVRRYTDTIGEAPRARDLGATCKTLFNLSAGNSLGEDEKFTHLVKKTGDIHFWMNSEELNKDNAAMPALAMVNMSKLYKGNITTAAINFENGKILMDVKTYASKEITELYKKYGGKNIDEDMIKRLPSKDVAAVFAMSFKPEGIKEFLKVLGLDAIANLGLTTTAGFSLDDFIKANKGDLVIAISDFKKSRPDTLTVDSAGNRTFEVNVFKQTPDFLFATSIADKEAFNLLIKAGEKLGKNMSAGIPVAYNSNGKYFAIGTSKEKTDQYITGNSSNNFDFLSKISGNPFGGYINFQYILKSLESNFTGTDSTSKIIYDASLKMWDNVYLKGGNYDDGGITQTIEVNLIDKNTNSLKQLNQYLGLLVQIREKKKREQSLVEIEEVTAYPPLSALPDTAKKAK
jgi:Domain of unknown function (DUF4836)